MPWQLLVAISVFTFSISVLLRRLLLSQDKSDPVAYVILFQGLVGLLTGVYAVMHGFHAPDFNRYWFPIVVTILLYAAAHIVSTKAFQVIEASIFSVLFATSAIWTMIGGFILFHDHLALKEVVGVLLVFCSVGILVEQKGVLKINKDILLGLFTGMLFGVATVGWAYVGKHADAASWTALSFIGPSLTVLIIRPRSVLKMKSFLHGNIFTRMLLLAIVFSISSLTSLLAYTRGNVSLVGVLQQTGIIVTTILAVLFLRERTNLLRKAMATVICFVAVLLIV